jgi:hypothetical protein
MLKPFQWSAHALGNLVVREIPREEADRTLAEPERVEAIRPARAVYMRRYRDARLGQEMLLRAVVDEESERHVVVTVYITSKIGKYMKGESP